MAEGEVHAFRTPDGLLDQARGREVKQLPTFVRRKMETFFEADFSDVRIHIGPEASAIGAIAFTMGSDIYFAPGQFEPDTPRGQELLGHELTHVLQQREGRVDNPFSTGVAVVQDTTLEEEADRMGRLVAAQAKASPTYHRERERASRAPSSRAGSARGEGDPPGSGDRHARSGARQASAAQRQGANYHLVVGAYLHQGDAAKRLPDPLAGHAFVALVDPSGERRAWGFSPANYGSYDPARDLGKLNAGVEGVVHDDAGAFAQPGLKTRAYAISEEQARAVEAKVAEYQAGKYRFSLSQRQCSAFAVDCAKAARIDELGDLSGRPPKEVYRKL